MGIKRYNYVVDLLRRAKTTEDITRALTRMSFDMQDPEGGQRQIDHFKKFITRRRDAGKTEYEAVREAADYLLGRVAVTQIMDAQHRQ